MSKHLVLESKTSKEIRVWLAFSAACLFGGTRLAAWMGGQRREWVISYLLSYVRNVQGHWVASVAVIAGALCFMPYAMHIARQDRIARLAMLSGDGVLMLSGVAALFFNSIGPLHDAMTALSLAGLMSGTLLLLWNRRGERWAIMSGMVLVVGAFLMVVSLVWEGFFSESVWWRQLGVLEWAVIAVLEGTWLGLSIGQRH